MIFLKTKRKSFSLIELMLVVLVLGVGILIVLGGFLNFFNNLRKAENKVVATEFLQSKLQELEFQVLEEGLSEGVQEGSFKAKGRNFNWRIKINSPSGKQYLKENLYIVKFYIHWLEAGIKKQLSFSIYLPKKKIL